MLSIFTPGRAIERLLRLSSYLFGSMLIVGTAGAWQASTADAPALDKQRPPTMYRVINLRPSNESLSGGVAFNARNQLAFSTLDPAFINRGWFYDNGSLVDIGSLNGRTTTVSGLNDAGQVIGAGFIRDVGSEENPAEIYHAFIWSKARGMRDLGTLGGDGTSFAQSINNAGQVVGTAFAADGRFHAFLWSARSGMRDLGLLASRPDSSSNATSINEAGQVAGTATIDDGSYRAFLWTRQSGMRNLGTLGGNLSAAIGISDDGLVAGVSTVRRSPLTHAFVWTHRTGMRDKAPRAPSVEAQVRGMTSNGHVFGVLYYPGGLERPFSWTRERGLRNAGTLGGSYSVANAGNNRGEVVGGSMTPNDVDFVATIWNPRDGLVNLNTRLRNAPAGLSLRNAYAISDDGYIFAESNAGPMLLVPDSCPTRVESLGPIVASSLVQVGRPFESSVSMTSEDKAASHNVLWNWGDGSGDQQGSARARRQRLRQCAARVHGAGCLYAAGQGRRPQRQGRHRQPHRRGL